MQRIGLTGGIASGKSDIAAYLESLGAPIVDADVIARNVTAPGQPGIEGIARLFGARYINADGTLNRKALGELVFSDPQKRGQLNALIHPLVEAHMLEEFLALERAGAPAALGVVPLLYEAGLEKLFDEVWLVSAGKSQLSRLMARDALSECQALLRIRSQMPEREKRARADAVIDNSSSFESACRQARALWLARTAIKKEP